MSLKVRRFLALFLCESQGCQMLPHSFTLGAQLRRALLLSAVQGVGKWGAGNGTSCSSQLPAGRAGSGRRNVSACLPQTITTSKGKQPKAQVPELTLPHTQIRYLWSHHSPLNEPMRVWPLFYWVKTFSHGQRIRKLDAMGDKGQRKKIPTEVKRHFSHIFSLSSSRKLIKLVSDVIFIQNATTDLWIEHRHKGRSMPCLMAPTLRRDCNQEPGKKAEEFLLPSPPAPTREIKCLQRTVCAFIHSSVVLLQAPAEKQCWPRSKQMQ